MASVTKIAILLAGALWLLCLPGIANSAPVRFIVEGDVYCEVCRTNFINRLSEPMPGAKVKLQCKAEGEGEGNVTYSLEGVTDAKGHYRLIAEGDRGEEECEVTLVESSRADCGEIPDEGWATMPSSRITLTKNSGFHGDTRQANPLGFTKKKAAAECAELFKELEINPNQEF